MIMQKKFALVIEEDRGPCRQARFGNWASLLNSTVSGQCEFVFCTSPIVDPNILAHTAVVIIPRPRLDSHASTIRMYGKQKKRYGYDVVLDFDDVMWSVDGKSPMTDYNPYPLDMATSDRVMDESIKWVDRVTCSTDFIAYCFCRRFGESWVDKVSVLPNYAFTSLAWEAKRLPRKKLSVWYGGSGCHFKEGMLGDFEGPWIPALAKAMEEGIIDFHAFGESKGVFPEGTILHGQVHSSLWLSTISRYAPDVYIAPLACNLFNKCKSPLKALEAYSTGSVFVASCFPGSPYSGFTTGLGCVTRETSVDDLVEVFRALKDPMLRRKCVKTQRAAVDGKGLVAESKEGMDMFIKTLFGRFVCVT